MAGLGIMSLCKAWRQLKVQRGVLLTSPGKNPVTWYLYAAWKLKHLEVAELGETGSDLGHTSQ